MDNPKNYLLRKIIGYEENGLTSLGYLNAKHIDDLSKVMEMFAEEAIFELLDRINKGECVNIGKATIGLNKKKKRAKI